MAGFLFTSKLTDKDNENVFLGKVESAVKAIMLDESNMWDKQKNFLTKVFNTIKTKNHDFAISEQSGFDDFKSVEEGGEPINDSVSLGYMKYYSLLSFKKEFTVTAEMLDDAVAGIPRETKKEARNFIAAYERTKIRAATAALANAQKEKIRFNNAEIDLRTLDGKPMFFNKHPYFTESNKNKFQSNSFYGNFVGDISNGATTYNSARFEEALGELAVRGRNFTDEKGNPYNYLFDTIIIPGNRPSLERIVKSVVGTEKTVGSPDNDINVQYGNWNVVVNGFWQSNDDRFILMSSQANRDMDGNMYIERKPLDIISGVDEHTRNYFINGFGRFNIGFGNWKHILLAVNSSAAVENSTQL